MEQNLNKRMNEFKEMIGVCLNSFGYLTPSREISLAYTSMQKAWIWTKRTDPNFNVNNDKLNFITNQIDGHHVFGTQDQIEKVLLFIEYIKKINAIGIEILTKHEPPFLTLSMMFCLIIDNSLTSTMEVEGWLELEVARLKELENK